GADGRGEARRERRRQRADARRTVFFQGTQERLVWRAQASLQCLQQAEASVSFLAWPGGLEKGTGRVRIFKPTLLEKCHAARESCLRPIALIQQLRVEVTPRFCFRFLSVRPMQRGWTKLFGMRPNKPVDQRQIKGVRTQPLTIKSSRQGARGMIRGILCREQANQRSAESGIDDCSFIFYFRFDGKRIRRQRTVEAQSLSQKTEHFELAIGSRIGRRNQICR